MNRWALRFCLVLSIAATAWPAVKTELNSYFFGDAAYFNEVLDVNGEPVSSEPYTRFIGGLDFYTWPTENFMIQVNPELISSTQLPQQPGRQDKEPRVGYVAYVEEGKAVWTFGDLARPSWQTSLGWQYYKDNPDGKIFGDYLLRSMIYPSLVFTKFHNSKTQVFGLRLMNNIGETFTHNFLIHSETQRYPFYDFSLAYTAAFRLGRLLEVGAGLHWVSAIPVRPSRTTPKGGEYYNVPDNIFKEVSQQESRAVPRPAKNDTVTVSVRHVSADSGEIVVKNAGGANVDSARFRLHEGKVGGLTEGSMTSEGLRRVMQELTDPASKQLYPGVQGTSHEPFSFSGQIVTLRLALNPLQDKLPKLGTDPFKIYAEGAVLGVKDYAGFYADRSERMPIMFGVNLPTFNLLDFLAFEAEVFKSSQPPSWQYRFRRAVPQPGAEIEQFNESFLDPDRAGKDDFKWGLSARKTFKGFALWAQGGTDHMHSSTFDESFHELMTRPSHWYFMTRLVLYTGL